MLCCKENGYTVVRIGLHYLVTFVFIYGPSKSGLHWIYCPHRSTPYKITVRSKCLAETAAPSVCEIQCITK